MEQITDNQHAPDKYEEGYRNGYNEAAERVIEIIAYGDKLHVQSKFIVERIIKELIYNEQ